MTPQGSDEAGGETAPAATTQRPDGFQPAGESSDAHEGKHLLLTAAFPD